MERIGLLGGTFDPPHLGHLWLAEAARQTLKLDKVLFLPAGHPPHKTDEPVTAVQHRRTMTALAIGNNDHFTLDMTDAERPSPHYTSTLLPLIQKRNPDVALWLLIGSDSLRDLPFWHEPERVITQCRLAVLPRPGTTVDWVRLSLSVPGVDQVVETLSGPTIEISSTAIRKWLAAGHQPRYLIPLAVLTYIQEHHLYIR
ncbi:MAG: nicotinate-nucleotide adenylyltransferase [Candidatus Promineifilaceae bacterium]